MLAQLNLYIIDFFINRVQRILQTFYISVCMMILRKKLISKGVLETEIAYIHDAKTEKQKTELFDKVRSGEVRKSE